MAKVKMKLAEALLRRKELQDKVDTTKSIKDRFVFHPVVRRINVADGIDEVRADVPRVPAESITAEHDHYARGLREIDAVIQQANWTAEVEVPETAVNDFVDDPDKYKDSRWDVVGRPD